MRDLNGQRVLITGASRGVGLAATEAFAREGARLALLARPSPALDDAVARARALGSDAVATPPGPARARPSTTPWRAPARSGPMPSPPPPTSATAIRRPPRSPPPVRRWG